MASRFPSIQFSNLDLVADIIVDKAWQIPTQLLIQLQDLLATSTYSITIGEDTTPDTLIWKGKTLQATSTLERLGIYWEQKIQLLLGPA